MKVTKMGFFMRLVGRPRLEGLKSEHPDAAKQIDAWCADVTASKWNSPHEVKERYSRSVDFPGSNKAIFNIRGNKYRILAKIDYERGVVLVEKAGTHEEYLTWRIK